MTEVEKLPLVVVAVDFSDEIMSQIRDAAPKFRVERHFPDVPDSAWDEAEILYTVRNFPEPSEVPHLRWIQLHYAGVDRVLKRPIVQAEDVEVTTASGIHATQIAEYCLMMMLAFNYKLVKMMDFKRAVTWPEKQYEIFRPHPLRGQTVGIAGYGSIGRELARMAAALGMTVLAIKRDLKHLEDQHQYSEEGTGDPNGDIPDRVYPPEALASMVAECDYLVVATPLTDATRHLVNARIFEAMKSNAVLINVARGGVIDEEAMISALAAEKIGGAALDVFSEEPLPTSSPLWNLDNVIISPHVSGNTSIYHEKAAAVFMENLRRYAEKRPLLNRIDREKGY